MSGRHKATTLAWEWLETGPGVHANKVSRARIARDLEAMDLALHELDAHIAAKFLGDPAGCLPVTQEEEK